VATAPEPMSDFGAGGAPLTLTQATREVGQVTRSDNGSRWTFVALTGLSTRLERIGSRPDLDPGAYLATELIGVGSPDNSAPPG
jgi:hypothetical protein